MEIITDEKKINEIFDRGTIVNVIPSKDNIKERMLNGERLRMYWGFDATAPTLHLSHAKNFMLLEKFRQLGHEVIVLFGDFTARIGDPTGEDSARKQLSREDVLENIKKWKEMVAPLMDFDNKLNPVVIKYNHDWLSKMNFEDVIKLSSNFTVQQMLERDMFDKRMKENKPIYVHEFFYPLMQGYDSVAMDVDIELCGTDQTFNALVGRTLQKRINNKEKSVIAVTLMENPKTGELMSKSKGTGVFLDWDANKMFGGVMAQDDEMLEVLFLNNTLLSKEEIQDILKTDARDAKLRLSSEIVKIFYGEEKALEAKKNWITQFSDKKIPDNLEEFNFSAGIKILEILKETKFVSSNKEGRRKIDEGAVKILSLDGEKEEKISDYFQEISEGEKVLKLGNINFNHFFP